MTPSPWGLEMLWWFTAGALAAELTGVIAAEDIYSGARITGATVWIAETGDSASSDASGRYEFADLPMGTYTVHAAATGYVEGTCAKEITTSTTYWCSIALMPEPPDEEEPEEPTDTGLADTGTGTASAELPQGSDTDGVAPADTAAAPADTGPTEGDGAQWDRVRQAEAGAGCDAGGVGVGWGFLAAVLALGRRREGS